MKDNENLKLDALKLACRQLEIMGYCPHAKQRKLSLTYFFKCTIAQQSVTNCHLCIRNYFEKKAKENK